MPYYAVHKGKFGPKIYNNWGDCKKSVDNFVGAIYKKFENIVEATKFMEEGFGTNGTFKPKFIQKKEDYESNNQDEISKVLNAEDAYKNMIIYTDGSCIRDNDAKKVYCGYGIVIPDLNIKLAEPLNDSKLTNNRAEMRAILHAIELVSEEQKAVKRLCIFTDSQYCKYIFQGTGERYEKDGFMKSGEEVPNKDMIITALSYIRKYNIVILKVRAHTDGTDVHSTYNDFADKLANEGAMKMKMGSKYKSNNNMIQNMIIKPSNEVKHPFEKKETVKASTPEVEIINDVKNSHRYNDKSDWREKEKEQFKNKTKLNEIFNLFTDEDNPQVENKVEEKKKVTKGKSNILSVFTDEEEPIVKKESIKKEAVKSNIFNLFTDEEESVKEVTNKVGEKKKVIKKESNIFNVFTDEDNTSKPTKKEEKREVTVKIINNKVKKFTETKLSDFM